MSINYLSLFNNSINIVKQEKRYREFLPLIRNINNFPKANIYRDNQLKEITMWCTNDYLGMSQNDHVVTKAIETIKNHGVGSGGTRNIGGSHREISLLEQDVARINKQEAALVFTSGYVANDTSLTSLAKIIPGLVFFSDELNHASMIAGIRNSRNEKYIYKHLDIEDLEKKLQLVPIDTPKVIVFESVYSMNGNISPVKEIVKLARKYNALTYIDEVHAVGLYGNNGAGIIDMLNMQNDIDILQGNFAKGYGAIGGYVTGKKEIIDAIRLTASGFIFTTSLPPAITAAARVSINLLQSNNHLRLRHQKIVKKVKDSLTKASIKFYQNNTHIIPIIIGDAALARDISLSLLHDFNIFVQHINFPTVPAGKERLRVTPTPYHSDEDIEYFTESLISVFKNFSINKIINKTYVTTS